MAKESDIKDLARQVHLEITNYDEAISGLSSEQIKELDEELLALSQDTPF